MCDRESAEDSREMGKLIEELLRSNQLSQAKEAIRRELRRCPESHWLWTRLSTAYYESRRYRLALRYAKRALQLAPKCPLALWDCAGGFYMIGQKQSARRIWKGLIHTPIHILAYGRCGEGMAWANGLLADCHFRLAVDYFRIGNSSKANEHVLAFLEQKRKRARSIYQRKDAEGLLLQLQTPKRG